MSPIIDELESLLFDWEEGSLDQHGVARVRQILVSSPEARTFFVGQRLMSAALRLEGDAGLKVPEALRNSVGPKDVSEPGGRYRRGFSGAVVAMLTTAALIIVVLAGRLVFVEFDARDPAMAAAAGGQTEEATSHGVALMTQLVDVTWSEGQVPIEVGAALTPGRFAIASGYAQIEFFSGATIVVQGPAELELESPILARVHSGRLRAQVPPAARGFSLELADMKVVDLGTEFGLAVSGDGATVQVFDGEVELHPGSHVKQNLTKGQGVTRTADGQLLNSELTPEQFLDIAAMDSRVQGQQLARYERWQAWSAEMRSDPRLIACYAFDHEGGWDRRLPCALQPTNSELDGEIVGARPVAGRWEMKQALEFKQPGDRVRVQVPGEFGSLTFAAWVRIDSLDRWFNSLFLTDHYNQGEPHWQILESGQMYFSVRPAAQGSDGPTDHKVLSAPFWQPSMSGKWLHLATTFNISDGRTTQYLNGEILHSETIPPQRMVTATRIGAASIGNWSLPTQPDAEFAVRNLNGRIDEFAIYAAALTAQEIREIYQNGKP